VSRAAIVLAVLGAACRLEPLVDDVPGASRHLLPAGAAVPKVAESTELMKQIELNDGLDDNALEMANGTIARGTGLSAGVEVRYWAFGAATRAPAPLYLFYRNTPDGLVPISHLPLLGVLPGDAGWNPIHNLYRVVVTSAYDGELITTFAALADAVELGLVDPPEPTGSFVFGPCVMPGTTIDTGAASPERPAEIYARGHVAEMFRFGGALGVQPGDSFVPTSQVAFLREPMKATYDATRPIFQAKIPTMPPAMRANYTPLSLVINVDLAPGITADLITQDADLFTRSSSGAITGTTANVALFTPTTAALVLQLQFEDGRP
jgi:hypothetical protein